MTTDADVLEAINVESFPGGQTVIPQALFGNTIEFDDSGNIVSARVMIQAQGRRGGHCRRVLHSHRVLVVALLSHSCVGPLLSVLFHPSSPLVPLRILQTQESFEFFSCFFTERK